MDKIPEEAHTTSIHAPSGNIRGTLSTVYTLRVQNQSQLRLFPSQLIKSHLKNPENTVAEFTEAHTYSIHAPSANVRAALFIL